MGNDKSLGVLTFIRDAFLDISERITKHTFLINELEGHNDISKILTLLDIQYQQVQTHPLRALLHGRENQIIKLENVMIQTQAKHIYDHEVAVKIFFKLDNTFWKYYFCGPTNQRDQRTCWNFEQVTNPDEVRFYMQGFNALAQHH